MVIKEGNGSVVWGDKLRVWDYLVHIAIHKTGNPQGPIVARGTVLNILQLPIVENNLKKNIWKWSRSVMSNSL